MSIKPSAPPGSTSVRWQLWIVAFGFFMQTLDTTIVNTALPSMAASLGENPLRMQSVIVSYVLTVAVMLPASGWLADRVGVKRVFFSAIVLSMVMQLSMSLGVSIAGILIGSFAHHQVVADSPAIHNAFIYSYGCMALIIALPALAFACVPTGIAPNRTLTKEPGTGSTRKQ